MNAAALASSMGPVTINHNLQALAEAAFKDEGAEEAFEYESQALIDDYQGLLFLIDKDGGFFSVEGAAMRVYTEWDGKVRVSHFAKVNGGWLPISHSLENWDVGSWDCYNVPDNVTVYALDDAGAFEM